MKKKNNKSGFVLAYTVVIMGVLFVVMAVVIAIVAGQNTRNKIIIDNFEEKMFVNQQQCNFENLSYDDYVNYLSNEAKNIIYNTNDNDYIFDKFIVNLSLDYTHICVNSVDRSKILFEANR